MNKTDIFANVDNSDAIISFVGTSGTGKTILANKLATYMPHKYFISNITSNVPVQERGTPKGQEQILRNYIEMFEKYENSGFICDRTLFDVCAYSLQSNAWSSQKVKDVLTAYTQCKFYPSYLFYVPIEFDVPKGDADRDPFIKIRDSVDVLIKVLLKTYALPYFTVHGTLEERLDQICDALR